MNPIKPLLIVGVSCLLLCSCTKKPEWWIGSWTVDPQASVQYAEKMGLPSEEVRSVVQLADGFKGAEISISETEIVLERDGSKLSNQYTVSEVISPNEVILDNAVGSSRYIFHIGNMVIYSIGDATLPVVFQRTSE